MVVDLSCVSEMHEMQLPREGRCSGCKQVWHGVIGEDLGEKPMCQNMTNYLAKRGAADSFTPLVRIVSMLLSIRPLNEPGTIFRLFFSQQTSPVRTIWIHIPTCKITRLHRFNGIFWTKENLPHRNQGSSLPGKRPKQIFAHPQ